MPRCLIMLQVWAIQVIAEWLDSWSTSVWKQAEDYNSTHKENTL